MSEPDAWGLLDEGEVHYATPFREEAEAALRRTGDTDSVVISLHRQPQPALTDAEREAMERAIKTLDDWQRIGGYHELHDDDAATLRGLLERLG